jgi:hypothetical protein
VVENHAMFLVAGIGTVEVSTVEVATGPKISK